ncbi:DUF4198 domain-containing protein [Chitinophaga nivalis]|uniref:DUF4198 domain-containing protein n=1 Tax=Chitinophaga nivalis TaxID=2991709 RepID=A0ABT3IQE8_9BACT|nr:DUF4198 domain-containing protein [Chitinophaga nivalis]MCW3464214.1 DUF4198 domain-containing protein [Chitinophaga nivalis]MCW3486096.1 DUF4198 domain-containing protein [Chitinophaga nivalis]
MIKPVKQFFLSVGLLLCCHSLFAHALWMETTTTGKVGQPQQVNIYLGEYAENQRDSIQHWFSNMASFDLWLVKPDGQKEKLTCVPNGNHFTATFTPAAEGAHLLTIDHTVKQVYGENKIHYYALGLVKVNGSLKGAERLKEHIDFALLTDNARSGKLNQDAKVQLRYKNTPPTGGDVTVQAPTGWAKKFKTNPAGDMSFSPAWAGRYMLEGTFLQNEAGKHEGKDFKNIWHCVTYCVNIDK